MTNYWIARTPYWFKPDGIKKVEELRQAVHMGPFCTKVPEGYWYEQPVEVFYQPNPDKAKGHSHYFGLLYNDTVLYIVNAESAFPPEGMTGVVCEDGEVLVSRYRHDYVERKGRMIDGGRDYTKHNGYGMLINVTVQADQFVFNGGDSL